MDADPLMLLDTVEFIDTTQSTISQDQGSCLQVPITSIFNRSYCQSFKNMAC